MSDVKFRKLTRILVHGKVNMCKEVFKDSLNDSRDPDRGQDGDRYTARYFLKHTVLEQAFDQLCEAGFRMVGSCASGTSAPNDIQELKPGQVILNLLQIVHLFLFRYLMDIPSQIKSGKVLLLKVAKLFSFHSIFTKKLWKNGLNRLSIFKKFS
jgi:hypothetical protein